MRAVCQFEGKSQGNPRPEQLRIRLRAIRCEFVPPLSLDAHFSYPVKELRFSTFPPVWGIYFTSKFLNASASRDTKCAMRQLPFLIAISLAMRHWDMHCKLWEMLARHEIMGSNEHFSNSSTPPRICSYAIGTLCSPKVLVKYALLPEHLRFDARVSLQDNSHSMFLAPFHLFSSVQ